MLDNQLSLSLSPSRIIHSESASEAVGVHRLYCSDVDVGGTTGDGWDVVLSPVI